MNIYSKNRTASYYYRKIYEDNNGPIPKDEEGRTYDIHHLDGNTENNDPSNLIAVSIKEHYEIHKARGDTKACLALMARMSVSPEEKRKLASEANSGEKNPSYGSRWWNNGVTEVRTKNKPEGNEWLPGRSKSLRDKINNTKIKNGNHPSGRKNGRFDHRIHTFMNTITGEIVKSTQYDFRTSRGYDRRGVNRMVDGSENGYKEWIIVKS